MKIRNLENITISVNLIDSQHLKHFLRIIIIMQFKNIVHGINIFKMLNSLKYILQINSSWYTLCIDLKILKLQVKPIEVS